MLKIAIIVGSTRPGRDAARNALVLSAILREIGTKGKDAHFNKTDRGNLAANE